MKLLKVFLPILVVLLTFVLTLVGLTPALALTNSTANLDEDLTAQVFIANEGPDQNGDMVTGFCNGTLLSPRILITAAHCIKDSYVVKSLKTRVQIGKYKFKTKPDGTVVRIGFVPFFDEYLTGRYFFTRSLLNKIQSQGLRAQIGPAEDIGVVLLDQPIAVVSTLTIPQVITAQELASIRSRLTDYAPTVSSINPFTEISTNDTKRMARLNDLSINSSGYLESKSVSRVEEGDSGAPMFVRFGKEWRLIGITKGRATSFFGDWDVYGLTDQKLCEISSQISASTNADATANQILCRK